MSNAVFPSLNGIAYPVHRSPIFDTIVQQNVSGQEVRLALQPYPRYQWDLSFSFLNQGTVAGGTGSDLYTLMGFYKQRQGSFDSFLYTDPDYSSVTAGTIGLGDGTTTAFQLLQSLDGFAEPVLAPNVVTTVFNNGTPVAAISAPTNGTLTSTVAGALAATTYYVKSTWVTATGETAVGNETSVAVLINKVLNVAAPGSAPTGATGWNVYVSNTAGGGSGQETLQNSTPIALGTAWVEPNTGLVAGRVASASDNNSAYKVNAWGTTSPGLLTFAVAPAAAHAITATFTFYWPVRFVDDKVDFSKWTSNQYEMKKISLMSVLN